MIVHYILGEGDTPIPEPDPIRYARWVGQNRRRKIVARSGWHLRDGRQVFVSTVFLGLDHNFDDSGPPVLWETMVFGLDGAWDDYTERYASLDEAKAGHDRITQDVHAWLGAERMIGDGSAVV